VHRAESVGVSSSLPNALTDEQLEAQLYPKLPKKRTEEERGTIDCVYIHKELKRKSVTLRLLWLEYQKQYPDGLKYSQFCNLYRTWDKTLDVWMRQPHKAGERMFVDYAGQTVPVVSDSQTGEVSDAQVFVATLGASSFTYVEATWTQTLPDWIGSHVKAFEFFGGCPEIVTPDNLKSGIHKAHIYEPDINPSYQDMATYYGVAIIPARSATPKDKAKVENGVLQVERQILAVLRNRTFFGLQELNEAISPLLDSLNERPFQKLPGSRLSQFLELEKPVLKPLPTTRYEYAEWKKTKAGFNYYIEIDKHFYSVPFTHVKKDLYVRYDTRTVEVFDQGVRVASHLRSYSAYGYTTSVVHMPKAHQKQAEWTPERITTWAKTIGDGTQTLCDLLMRSRPHP
jgi:transposase